MRLPFLRPKKTDEAAVAPPPKRRAAAAAAEPLRTGDDDLVAAARTRARRRLVGALVLLAVGVIGFPILFETQPRPLPLDTPIEAPRREASALPLPAATPPRGRPAPLPVLPADAGNETAAAPPSAAAPAPQAAPAPAAPIAPGATTTPAPAPRAESAITPVVTTPAPKPAAAPPQPAPSAAAAPAVPAPAAPATAATPANGRFVVQVGAYTDAGTLRDARAKVEKLGMKTYTQVVENDAGKRTRVRLGPFATREEADAAAAKVKRAGLPAAILAL